jgi:hypothetical protein
VGQPADQRGDDDSSPERGQDVRDHSMSLALGRARARGPKAVRAPRLRVRSGAWIGSAKFHFVTFRRDFAGTLRGSDRQARPSSRPNYRHIEPLSCNLATRRGGLAQRVSGESG